MKQVFIFFLLFSLSATAQVKCANLPDNYSGKCESYDARTNNFGTYTYKKGLKHGDFNEYYSNRQLMASGSYKADLLHGDFLSYYVSGELLAKGKFKSGSGDFTLYHVNGNRKLDGRFDQGKPSGSWITYDASGKSIDVSKMDGKQQNMFVTLTNPTLRSTSQPMNSFSFGGFGEFDIDSMMNSMRAEMDAMMNQLKSQMNGFSVDSRDSLRGNFFSFDTTFTWNSFGDFGQMFDPFSDSSFSKSFHFDTIIRSFSGGANPYFGISNSDLVDFPDVEPSFIGGEEAMNQFIESEMRYPESEGEADISGTVFVEAIIEKDGSISQPRIALGVNDVLDKEAIRIVTQMPLWKPALSNDKTVRTRCIIPVKFSN